MSNKLQDIFEEFDDLNVLIVGDVMVDSYIWGAVNRISPEAPVPIVSINQNENRLGGAANVALNIHALGATPLLCSVVGTDYEGDIFIDLMQKADLATHGIIRSEHRQTTIKQRVISDSQQLLRVDKEDTHGLEDSIKQKLIQKIISMVKQVDVIIFEDYDKGVIDDEVIGCITERANAKHVPIIVDPKKRNFHNYKNATLFKPNLKEIRMGLNAQIDPSDETQLENAIRKVMRTMTLEGVMVTLSEKGVFIIYKNEKHLIPAHIRDIADVSGAGDTVVSVAAICVALGLPAKIIAELSNLSGGLVCEHVGVAPIDRNQLLQEAIKYKIL